MAELVEWLLEQSDGVEIVWWCNDMKRDTPWQDAWVDVQCDAIEESTGHNWAWTIQFELDEDDLRESHIMSWPPDMVSLRAFVEGEMTWVDVAVVPLIDGLADPDAWRAAARNGPADCTWFGAPAWSAAAISAAIQDWCAHHGRHVRAAWDPDHAPSQWYRDAEAIMEGIELGIEPQHLLIPGDGDKPAIYASDAAFDALLGLDFGRLEEDQD